MREFSEGEVVDALSKCVKRMGRPGIGSASVYLMGLLKHAKEKPPMCAPVSRVVDFHASRNGQGSRAGSRGRNLISTQVSGRRGQGRGRGKGKDGGAAWVAGARATRSFLPSLGVYGRGDGSC